MKVVRRYDDRAREVMSRDDLGPIVARIVKLALSDRIETQGLMKR